MILPVCLPDGIPPVLMSHETRRHSSLDPVWCVQRWSELSGTSMYLKIKLTTAKSNLNMVVPTSVLGESSTQVV